MSFAREASPGRRMARLGWATVILTTATVLLLAMAIWALTHSSTPSEISTGILPVPVEVSRPGIAVVLATGAATAAIFVGVAALQTATAARVLARSRRRPRPIPPQLRLVRRWVLGPVAVKALQVEAPPVWPPSAVPSDVERVRGGRVRCTVLIPAHNEAGAIGATLLSLREQSRPPDRVIVVADNCTDTTALVARSHGVRVLETVGNEHQKAGALNQALAEILPRLSTPDVVMVMDADSTIATDFLEVGLGLLEADPDLMAVSGLFYGAEGAGLLGQLQRNEFHRYQRHVARHRGRVFVLTGTASLIRGYALQAVADTRGELIPGTPGDVYDTFALTEDNELTLALKTLGARMTSPPECRVTTEIKATSHELWLQRLRWHRGALENIAAFGVTRTTARYWLQQIGLGYGVVALNSYLLLLAITLLAAEELRWSPFWVVIGSVFVVERIVTVWPAGWPARLVAAPVVIEICYDLYLQACFIASFVQMRTGQKAGWGDLPESKARSVGLPAMTYVYGILLPTTVLTTGWYEALALFVGVNTLVFAALSVAHLLPTRHRANPSTFHPHRGGVPPPEPRSRSRERH